MYEPVWGRGKDDDDWLDEKKESYKHSDNWNLQWASVFNQRHWEIGENLCLFARQHRIYQNSALHLHSKTCTQGKTNIDCPNKRIKVALNSFENEFSKALIAWLVEEVKARKIHIIHGLCGHGGERYIEKHPVDG